MTWVKICGIREATALDAAVEAGADAVGLNIAPASPRVIDLDTARDLHETSPLPTFLVCVDLTISQALEALEATGVDGIQPHGEHSMEVAETALGLGKDVLLPIPVGESGPCIDLATVPVRAIPLFDTRSLGAHGGTGKAFDWDLVSGVRGEFVVAGGLGVDNVASAIRSVRPYGVDASSRLELTSGVKDPDTIRAFVREAKQA